MQVINHCIQSIKELMDEIAAASRQQSGMIVSVENGIKEISAVVQTVALSTSSLALPQRTVLVWSWAVMSVTFSSSPWMEAACSTVPWDTSWAPEETCLALVST